MTVRQYIDNATQRKVSGAITAGVTSITLDSLVGLPTNYPYTATLGLGTTAAEQVLVTAAPGGNSLTVTRNYNGQGAFSHPDSETFDHTAVAKDYQESNAHVNATFGVHGVAGSVVGTTDPQTLTSKTLTSPTINGGTQNTPTINTPNLTTPTVHSGLAVASGALTVSAGNATVSGTLTAGIVNGGQVSGVVTLTSYTNEAAATAALVSPSAQMTVWLTAPTGGYDPGSYIWNGSAWVPVHATVASTNLTVAGGLATTDFGAGADGQARVACVSGTVRYNGLVTGTISSSGTFIVTAGGVPALLRPFHKLNLLAFYSSGPGRVIVQSDGSIECFPSATASYVDLGSISYPLGA